MPNIGCKFGQIDARPLTKHILALKLTHLDTNRPKGAKNIRKIPYLRGYKVYL